MTPEQAEKIYQDARMVEYHKSKHDYSPVNQRATVLAGYRAVIDAVTKEVDYEYALRMLAMSDVEKPHYVHLKPKIVADAAGLSGERDASV